MNKNWEVIKQFDYFVIQNLTTFQIVASDIPDAGKANLFLAAPQLYAAAEAADTAFAVLNISDLTPQARGAVREAWPLVQEARAAARPNSAYAEAIAEAHQHEIARLDGIIKKMSLALESALNTAEFERHPSRPWHHEVREALELVKNMGSRPQGDQP